MIQQALLRNLVLRAAGYQMFKPLPIIIDRLCIFLANGANLIPEIKYLGGWKVLGEKLLLELLPSSYGTRL